MNSHLKPILLRHLSAALLFLGMGVGWLLSTEVNARELDLDHRVVPAIVLKDSPLKLIGTAVTRDPDGSVAVIEDLKNRRQWSFHEGDRAGSILIKSIRRDHIVIDAGNGDETVKNKRLSGNSRPPAAPPVRPISGPSATSINRVSSRERLKVIDRAVAEAAFADPASVLDHVDIMPARFLNREVGFRIAAFDPDSIFSKMGLRSGDLVLAINDQ